MKLHYIGVQFPFPLPKALARTDRYLTDNQERYQALARAVRREGSQCLLAIYTQQVHLLPIIQKEEYTDVRLAMASS
jgi:hypothetical protein